MIKIVSIVVDITGIDEIMEYFDRKPTSIRANFDEADNEIRSLLLEYALPNVPLADQEMYDKMYGEGEREPGQLQESAYERFMEIGKDKFVSITRWYAKDPFSGEEYAIKQEKKPYEHPIKPEHTPAKYGEIAFEKGKDQVIKIVKEYVMRRMEEH